MNILLDIFTSSILFLYLQNSRFLSPTSRVPQKMNWCLGEYFFVKVILNNYCNCTITVTVQLFYICSTLRITGFIQGISAFTYNILYITFIEQPVIFIKVYYYHYHIYGRAEPAMHIVLHEYSALSTRGPLKLISPCHAFFMRKKGKTQRDHFVE